MSSTTCVRLLLTEPAHGAICAAFIAELARQGITFDARPHYANETLDVTITLPEPKSDA